MNEDQWYAEGGVNKHIKFKYKSIIYSGRSRFQAIDIVDTEEFGPMLFLDGVANSSSRDEFIYHEAMVHPTLLTHPNPETVCVIGGAEGGTIREILRHPTIKRVVMVDIDEELVQLCRKYLPHYSRGAYEDPRLELIIGDGRKYLAESGERFDAVIVDLTDPVPDSPSVYLYTREFYRIIFDRLADNGLSCYQGESLQPWRIKLHAHMYNTLKTVFPHVAAYPYSTPCFHEQYAMLIAAKGEDPRRVDLAGRLRERALKLEYLTPEYLPGLFYLPGFVTRGYAQHPEILTDENPEFFYNF